MNDVVHTPKTDGLVRIEVEGFRSIRKLDLVLEPIHVVIGANGAGKSNLLGALRLLPLLRTSSLRDFVARGGGASSMLYYGPKVTKEMSLRATFTAGTRSNRYHARWGYGAGDNLVFLDEAVAAQDSAGGEWQIESLGVGHLESQLDRQPTLSATGKATAWWLSQMSFFHFHDTSSGSRLRQSSWQEADYLRSDGSNLAGYLLALSSSASEAYRQSFARIEGLVRRIAPFIKRLKPTLIDPGDPGGSKVRLDWVDERDEVFGCHQLSDGSLRAIALITALAQPVEKLPRFISIDEPELGLHPAALALFAELVRSVSHRTRIILATQSPTLLDHFSADEVIVADRVDRASDFRRLDEQQLMAWLDEYSLSELYDKNVLGGRP